MVAFAAFPRLPVTVSSRRRTRSGGALSRDAARGGTHSLTPLLPISRGEIGVSTVCSLPMGFIGGNLFPDRLSRVVFMLAVVSSRGVVSVVDQASAVTPIA